MLVSGHSAAIMANNGSSSGYNVLLNSSTIQTAKMAMASTAQTPVGSIVGTIHSTETTRADDGFFTAIIAAVIAVVVLVFICLFVVIIRYMYRYKGTYHTNEAKGTEFAETADAALRSDPALQDAMDENKKEYFI
ncbi:glycophorin-C isoform X1 [Astyanax mexicanus]|uniref:Glycophorin C (Gerbich blood group) n=2 Tax=Astyanax mexicanus TaxID=7994 RepID=A0A3B1KLZ4_ASTMX|nr:glycophorin-C isoform X1 [Astyanax mexicanus]XP_007230099.2 glycophorin-C isoform X1 [Astyanax mexicanus]XP_049340707.1 glycophorin-C isoform X1 [Astyanax mexicanus]